VDARGRHPVRHPSARPCERQQVAINVVFLKTHKRVSRPYVHLRSRKQPHILKTSLKFLERKFGVLCYGNEKNCAEYPPAFVMGRAGLKADAATLGPAPLAPRSMVFGWIVHFFQIHLALENSVETPYKFHC